MRYSSFITVLLCLSTCSTLIGQNSLRGVAVVDLSLVDDAQQTNAQLFSAEHMVKVAGLTYIVTKDLREATKYSTILLSSKLSKSTLPDSLDNLLDAYVFSGGIVIVPILEDEQAFELFGIATSAPIKTRFTITWDPSIDSDDLEWIDEPEEWTISLGRANLSETIKTYGYSTTSAEILASYEDMTAAVTRNQYGLGQAISLGVSWKDVILRNQINRDFQAQRVTSNGFEPTSDVFSLFVRSVAQAQDLHTVWMHTSPTNSRSTLIVTHDIDSQSGMDSLSMFVDYESRKGIEATYNVTTRYFNDALMGAFYTGSETVMDYTSKHGQSFGSHSVGHFFDFADEDIFPLGAIGNTIENYQPYNDGDFTTGGTVYGECELSKDILEADLEIPITFFRAGHLAYPKYLIDVLQDLDYLYNSSSSASDVLTSFPYQNVLGRSFTGAISTVYDIPVSISDVFHDDHITIENYSNLVKLWNEVTVKNMNNGAPTTLLIHPNRGYKVDALAEYIENLPPGIVIKEITEYGDFWRSRASYHFESKLDEEQTTLTIQLLDDINAEISFVCDGGALLEEIIILDKEGTPLTFQAEPWGGNDLILYFGGKVSSNANTIEPDSESINVFPNPTSGEIHINYQLPIVDPVAVNLYDINGNHMMHLLDLKSSDADHQLSTNLNAAPGTYLLHFTTSINRGLIRKIVVF